VNFALDDLDRVAEDLLAAGKSLPVWLFYGEMGAGKTTLIKAICRKLGVQSAMTSPTFSIVNEYESDSGDIVYHFDFYRLKKEEEAYDIGVEEYLDSGRLCLIEWPERIAGLLPDERFELHIEIESPTIRRIRYQKYEREEKDRI
jgi:tRNA threonylcarbamoyladenosine biosynthesis protein TsaE